MTCLNWIHVVVLTFRKLSSAFLKLPPTIRTPPLCPNSAQCAITRNNLLPPYKHCATQTSMQSSNKCTWDMMVARVWIIGPRNNGGLSNVDMAKVCYAMHKNDHDRRNDITSWKQQKQTLLCENIPCQNGLAKNDIWHINSYAKCLLSVDWSKVEF